MVKESFASAFSALDCYLSIYEDGKDAIIEAQQILSMIFYEEHHEILNHDTAREILDGYHNERGAGRKAKVSDDKKEMIRQKKKEGQSSKKIASEYGISTRYVNMICR